MNADLRAKPSNPQCRQTEAARSPNPHNCSGDNRLTRSLNLSKVERSIAHLSPDLSLTFKPTRQHSRKIDRQAKLETSIGRLPPCRRSPSSQKPQPTA
ncbi:MAG: hypothetical protein HC860_25185 [Alkalinema sp. RU_4_3]|nr:hypothetical protein [Alkalinema sp. RU_4_3]